MLETFAIPTTAVNKTVAPIHHRMPVILTPTAFSPRLAGCAQTAIAYPLIHESPLMEACISRMSLGAPASRRHRAKRERVPSEGRKPGKDAGRRDAGAPNGPPGVSYVVNQDMFLTHRRLRAKRETQRTCAGLQEGAPA